MALSSNPGNGLTSDATDVLDYCEQVWLLNGRMAEVSDISIQCLLPESQVAQILSKVEVKAALKTRGVRGEAPTQKLDAMQLLAVNTMLNTADRRSNAKKLKDLGIPPAQWQSWQKDPVFATYLRTRAEGVLTDAHWIAMTSLVDNMESGDVGSIKLYLEMTGRHASTPASSMDPRYFVQRILEAVQKHVTSEQLAAISDEILGLTTATTKELI